ITTHEEVCRRQLRNECGVMWIQCQRLLDVLNRLIPASLPPLHHPNKERSECVIGQVALSQGKLGQGRAVIQRSSVIEESAREMDFACVRLKARRGLERFFSQINMRCATIVHPK